MITAEYREQNRQLHETAPAYGTSGVKYAKLISKLAAELGTAEILDWGCGKQTLAGALPQYIVHGYDPCIEGLDEMPRPHDLVVCTDVLEHVEPDYTHEVIDELYRLTGKALFLIVSTVPANRCLPDGRNTHINLRSSEEWLRLFLDTGFRLHSFAAGTSPAKDPVGFMAVLRKEAV